MSKAKKLKVEEKPILWKDRRRIFGMPISFTSYQVSEDRLYVKKGLFNTETDELLLYRVMDIRQVRKFWQKIFRVGTVSLFSTDKTCPKLDLRDIKHPDKVRKFISTQVETQRDKRRIAGLEHFGSSVDGAGEIGV